MNIKKIITFFFTFILAFIFAYLPSTSTFAAKQQHYASVEELLANQKTIRFILDSGSGFGNQKASVDVIRWLHNKKFSGTIELVYPKVIANKLVILFNLPSELPKDPVLVDGIIIKFIEYNDFINLHRKKLVEQIALGMTGGVFGDKPEMLAKVEGIDISDYSDMEKQNYANFLDVEKFVGVWPTPMLERIPAAIFTKDKLPPIEPSADTTFTIVNTANLTDTEQYLESNPNGKDLAIKKPALKPFIEGMKNGTYNVMPTYGYTVDNYFNVPGVFPGNILQIIAAAHYAQLARPHELGNKPLIIPIFYDFSKKNPKLIELINSENWGTDELPGANEARETIKKLDLKNTVSIADISDTSTIATIKNLRPGHILLLSMRPLPSVVFDGIYTYSANNIWPQIREGDNSFNSLIHTGKPHIRCESEWELDLNRFTDSALKIRLESFYSNFCEGLKTWKNNKEKYQELGELIIDANNPNSNFSHYFQTLKIESEKPEHDRTRRALEEIIHSSR